MADDCFNTLTNRLIQSDRNAFDRIFRLLYAPLVRFSYKYLKDKEAASDVVQESFIKLWKIRHELTENESIKSYLFRTVRNRSLNVIRDSSYEVTGLENIEIKSDERADSGVMDPDATAEKLNMLKSWIQKLPDRQRDVIEMSRFEGLNHAEIAEVLDISKRTVNNHVVAAMKNIKQFHDEYNGLNQIH